jgi:hypothetical protein
MSQYGDAIVVRLTGGLGNQLFGLAAGLSQARRLGCRLVLDARNYGQREIRSFELGHLGYEVIWPLPAEQNLGQKLIRRSLDPTRNLTVFKEAGFNFDDSINQIKPGSLLLGYFQSFKYFVDIECELERLLQDAAINIDDSRYPTLESDVVTMHVRRGDYLDEKTISFHGLATTNYFNRSLGFLNSKFKRATVNVFTDSPGHLDLAMFRTEFELNLVDDKLLSSIEALNVMSRANAFIMSNSSFSWWAAWLMSRRNDRSEVIAPRPWFASGASAHDLLKPDWITLDAR